MSHTTIDDVEILEVISYLRRKGQSGYANKVQKIRDDLVVGERQYKAGIISILRIEKALTQKVPRDLILTRIAAIVKEMKDEM